MFRDRLEQEMKKAHRMGQSFALLFIDLDRFKEVNDTLGHEIGDMLLKETAHRLQTCVRESDTVARLGGDEFTIILESIADPGDVPLVAQKIVDTVSQPMRIDGHDITTTVSVGLSLYPIDSEHAEDLIRHADMAMYMSKKGGRNHYRFFTADMKQLVAERPVAA